MACKELGISIRTLQRWQTPTGVVCDGRRGAHRPKPANQLSEAERRAVVEVCNRGEYASLPPSQIVPALADAGVYLASESSFYRILRANQQQHHRGRSARPSAKRAPRRHCATAPDQVWCWDITWLPGPVKGLFFYLYLILDLYSRKIVAQEVYSAELSEFAASLVHRAVLSEGCAGRPLVLHSDNGSPMKGSSLQEKLYTLGVVGSYSRPRVSNDNAYAEAIFRTCKYRPSYPSCGFASLTEAREWVLQFTRWYNNDHKHSAICFVTPNQRHGGEDHKLLASRDKVYEAARVRHPERWTRTTRNWKPVEEVWLNPETKKSLNISRKAA